MKTFKEKQNKEDIMKCRKCGTTTANTWHGEHVMKGIFRKREVIIWTCHKCEIGEFIKNTNSNPQLLSQYYHIYGKSPEEVLGNLKTD